MKKSNNSAYPISHFGNKSWDEKIAEWTKIFLIYFTWQNSNSIRGMINIVLLMSFVKSCCRIFACYKCDWKFYVSLGKHVGDRRLYIIVYVLFITVSIDFCFVYCDRCVFCKYIFCYADISRFIGISPSAYSPCPTIIIWRRETALAWPCCEKGVGSNEHSISGSTNKQVPSGPAKVTLVKPARKIFYPPTTAGLWTGGRKQTKMA